MSLVRYAGYNILGLGLPLIAAAACIPFLFNSLGSERFGILTLIWAVISYFGIFDLGISRALTQRISYLRGQGDEGAIAQACTTAFVIMACLSIAGGVVLFVAAAPLVGLVGSITDKSEATVAMRVIASSLPAIILTSGLRGVLEAFDEFKVINLIRVPQGLFTFVAPVCLILVQQQAGLVGIAVILALGRYAFLAIHGWACLRHPDVWRHSTRRSFGGFFQLATQGGWLTLSNLVSQVLSYCDRFIIGAAISAQAVAFYVTPLELVLKLWILPGALTAVLFPRMARQSTAAADAQVSLYKKSMLLIGLCAFPVTTALAVFSKPILNAWIGHQLPTDSAEVMTITSCGMLIGCIGQVSFTHIQSLNRSRITALVYVIELPLYFAAVYAAARGSGIVGVAWVWLLRVTADTLLMNHFSARLLQASIVPIGHQLGVIVLATAVVYAVAAQSDPLAKAVFVAIVSMACVAGLLRLRARRRTGS